MQELDEIVFYTNSTGEAEFKTYSLITKIK